MKITIPNTSFTYYIEPDDVDFLDYKSRLATAGHVLSPANKSAVSSFVKKLKTDNLWAKCILLAPFVGANLVHSYVTLKSPVGNFTTQNVGSVPTFANNKGVIFTGTGDGIISGINPATHFAANNNFGVWAHVTSGSMNAYVIPVGIASNSLELVVTGGGVTPQYTGWSAPIFAPAAASVIGLYGGQNSASGQQLYKDGTLITSGTATPTALTSEDLIIGKRAAANLPHPVFSLGFVAATASMTAPEIANFTAAVSSLMSQLGR